MTAPSGLIITLFWGVFTSLIRSSLGLVLSTTAGITLEIRNLSISPATTCHLTRHDSVFRYWKSVFTHLEGAGIPAWVIKARHMKNVPGRKTNVADSEWLAQLARFGLVRASFIPPRDLCELRLVSCYRTNLPGMLASEKNHLHKLLDNAGIKLGGVVSDIDGVSARTMVEGLIAEESAETLASRGLGALKNKREALEAAMEGELSSRHRLVLQAALHHVRYLEEEFAQLDRYLIEAMQPHAWAWRLLQTIPGLDEIAAAMILIEIGDDLSRFGSASRLASWAALCSGNNEPAGKRKSGRTHHGNPIVRINSSVPSSSCSPAASRIEIRGSIRGDERGEERTALDPGTEEVWLLAYRSANNLNQIAKLLS